MVTVRHAQHAHGYTRHDHLIDDSPLADLIGRNFRDAGAARRAASKISLRTQDSRCRMAPIRLDLLLQDGSVITVTD